MTDYGVSAQYYDLFASAAHADADQKIAEALGSLDTAYGPVIDIGAGTGLSTALIAATLPQADILAVEPDASMRAALMTRILSEKQLRNKVTIVPQSVLEAPLPDRISGAVLSASLVHFSPGERSRLWHLLADRLALAGRIVVEIQNPIAEAVPETHLGEVAIGRVTYSATAKATKIDESRQRWTVDYCSVLDGNQIAHDTVSYECWAVSGDQVAAEAKEAGLTGLSSDGIATLEKG